MRVSRAMVFSFFMLRMGPRASAFWAVTDGFPEGLQPAGLFSVNFTFASSRLPDGYLRFVPAPLRSDYVQSVQSTSRTTMQEKF